jgi:hypothetical protein
MASVNISERDIVNHWFVFVWLINFYYGLDAVIQLKNEQKFTNNDSDKDYSVQSISVKFFSRFKPYQYDKMLLALGQFC